MAASREWELSISRSNQNGGSDCLEKMVARCSAITSKHYPFDKSRLSEEKVTGGIPVWVSDISALLEH